MGGTNARQRLEQFAETPLDSHSESGVQESSGLRRRALESVRQEFDDRTWTAFWRSAVEGDRPADVADDLGVTVWAVYKARSRILQRLRNELEGLLD